MATGGYFVLPNKAEADIDTPASGYVALFNDADATNTPAYKDSAGAVHSFTGPTGPTGPGYTATSTTSLAIGTGSKAFTTQAGLAYSAGARVRATSAAAPTVDYMEGVCTAYTGTTLTVTMDLVGGSGTHTDWDLNVAGDQGIQGAGVPPTVVSHGSMGATETFDYSAGPSHTGTVNAALTVTLTGWAAGECILTLGLTNDGTGGYGAPSFGAEVVNAADLANIWDDTAGAHNLVVLYTVDSGTTVYVTGLPPTAFTLDAVLAVSSGEDIADALSGAAAPAAGNVFATMADVAGSGTTPSATFLTTSDVTMTNANQYYDGVSITPAAGTYVIWGAITASYTGGGANFTARLLQGAATVLHETSHVSSVAGEYNSLTVFGYATFDGSTTLKLQMASNGAGCTIRRTAMSNGTTDKQTKLMLLKIA